MICSPPPGPDDSDQEALWTYVASGQLPIVSAKSIVAVCATVLSLSILVTIALSGERHLCANYYRDSSSLVMEISMARLSVLYSMRRVCRA